MLLRPSIYLIALFIMVTLACMIAIFLTDIHGFWQFILLLLVMAVSIHSILVHGLKSAKKSINYLINNEKNWLLRDNQGNSYTMVLQSDSIIHPIISILNFQCPTTKRKKTVLLTVDDCDSNALHRMIVDNRVKS